MKKYTLIILLIVLCDAITLSAQNTLRSNFLDNVVHAIPLDNGEMVVLAHIGDFSSGQKVYRVKNTGGILNHYESNDQYVIEEIAVGADNSVFTLGWLGGCDYSDQISLSKFDVEGNLLWNKPTQLQGRISPVLNTMKNGPDGGVLIHDPYNSTNIWALYDSTGTLVNSEWISGELETAYHPVNGHFVYLNSGILTFESNNTHQSSLPTVPQGLVTEHEIGFVGEDNVILFSSYDNTAYLYDNQLNLLHTVQIDNLYGIEAPVVTSNEEYIYIGADNKVLRLDYNLQIINEVEFTYGKMEAIAATTTQINFIGNDGHYTYVHRGDSALNFINYSPDVGVVEILTADIDTVTCGYQVYGFCYYGGCAYRVDNIRVVVENLGASPVFGFEINAKYPDDCPLYCNEDRSVYRDDYGAFLLPGERDTVDFPSMYLRLESFLDICLYTTRPFDFIDSNPENDRLCASIETFLPIELSAHLKASVENKTTILTWETATETNNQGFEIQKSRDGVSWEKIGWIDGRGDALTPHAYTYTDENLLSGTTYYRFKQLDFDGTSTYSNLVNVQHTAADISIHPNPVKNTLYITNLNGATIEHVNIFDQTGRQVISTKIIDDTIDVSNLSAGVYIIEIHLQGGILHEKIVVE